MSRIALAKRGGTAKVLWFAIAAGLFLVLGANAHLVYVAERSQPACVTHVKRGESGGDRDTFSAAQSTCSPQVNVLQPRKGGRS